MASHAEIGQLTTEASCDARIDARVLARARVRRSALQHASLTRRRVAKSRILEHSALAWDYRVLATNDASVGVACIDFLDALGCVDASRILAWTERS